MKKTKYIVLLMDDELDEKFVKALGKKLLQTGKLMSKTALLKEMVEHCLSNGYSPSANNTQNDNNDIKPDIESDGEQDIKSDSKSDGKLEQEPVKNPFADLDW